VVTVPVLGIPPVSGGLLVVMVEPVVPVLVVVG
jgi:hypothetical protein